ncbi:16S rRNA (adenine(1518)-N(6)/adenine(1519)-N(6))-dimethyltransferase RsmA [Buchnera aphidicola]|uniref:16S rRNA (adenine(1518)-N(6)/adenine(1519)-N(6))- dimethyltransferase RsmA n=1 Tax=Buchnera aphidicola TaxID=9 RepID=UPI00094D4DBC|nr:16S rRNA (adenine(1518)-N(6)/adenine(1519)-N(6))-dimethyltransferase RsmA [Buchnera aphidicola]
MYIKNRPIKRLGQNFLINKDIIDKIIQKIGLHHDDNIFEIGPGFGALTFPICDIVRFNITVLEIDKRIVFFLSKCKYSKQLNIILIDAMKFDFQLFFSLQKNILYRFIGNLPYGISTSFFLYITPYHNNILDIHFMFQKEVANRIIAKPGTKEYGRLSIMAQYFYFITPILRVQKHNFFPTPKVDSIFLKFKPYYKYNRDETLQHYSALQLITRKAFQHRRKLLYKNLSLLFSKKELLKVTINPLARAENISVHQYYLLVNYFLKRER